MKSDTFQDAPHIERIAEALWAREPVGSAALLVGAGFSRNAVPIRPSAGGMPGWNDIYETMVDYLYPAIAPLADADPGCTPEPEPEPASHRDWLLRQAGATSAYLRIAEEFEAQFGRAALDQLILHHVPDRQFEPGRLHHMLLQLPWADVMTTNWDTLLERAAEATEERVYDILRTVEDIPEARSPRIVKLHGSFPSHRPFVFTEEDFRKYPVRSGAFLNLAQQLAMENTLVLLGFSGDDPNFLFWSGWVRDRLGQNAPLIYLVGALGFSAPKRKMLESRRIQPIDLAQLPQFDKWPVSRRVELAHQWFLERLRAAEPYPKHRWPRASAGMVPPPELVASRIDVRAPRPDPELPSSSTPGETLRLLVPQWRQNRSVYPGWVVPPFETSELLWRRIDENIGDIVRALRELQPDERLEPLFELNWQLEAALMPLVLTVDDILAETLNIVVAGYDSLPEIGARQVRALVLAMIRHAREEREVVTFQRWADWLQYRIADEPDLLDRLTYERILWARSELDMDAVEKLLAGWEVHGDSYWGLRKAGLLADLGRDDEAADMSAEVLATIRTQTLRGGTDIASWSRESFALLFRSAVLLGEFERWSENKPIRDRFDLRQDQLQARGCPGKRDFFMLTERLGQTPPTFQQRIEINPKFDLGTSTVTHHMARIDPRLKRLTAYQALRFQEETGLPVRIGHAGLSGQLLTDIARWLMDVAPTRAIDAFLRASPTPSNKLFDKLLSRTTVARTSPEEAHQLIGGLIRMIESARRRIAARGPDAAFWRDRLKSALEIASRFVVIAPGRAAELLSLGLSIQADGRAFRRPEYDQELADIVRRTLEVAPDGERDAMLLTILRTPIPSRRDRNEAAEWDPASGLSRAYDVTGPSPEWKAVVEETLVGLRDPNTRLAASVRLSWLLDAGAVAEEDRGLIGEALWMDTHLSEGLPAETVFYPASFLDLPKPEGCDPTGAIRALLIGGAPLTDQAVAAGDLSNALAAKSLIIDVSTLEAQVERFTSYIREHDPEPKYPDIFGDSRLRVVEHSSSIGASLARRAASEPALRPGIKALFALDRYPLRREPAVPWLMRVGLLEPEVVKVMLRRLFASTERIDPIITQELFNQIGDLGTADAPFEKIFWQEISWTLAGCRSASLLTVLRFCVSVARDDPTRLPESLDVAVGACLRSILEDTEQTMPSSHLAYDPYLARRFAAALAKLLRDNARIDPALGEAWSAAVERDPLPDARRI